MEEIYSIFSIQCFKQQYKSCNEKRVRQYEISTNTFDFDLPSTWSPEKSKLSLKYFNCFNCFGFIAQNDHCWYTQ